MFRLSNVWRALSVCLILTVIFSQTACDISSRLSKPISDFEDATSVVTAQARLAYGELNRAERIRAIKTARRLKKRIDPEALRKADLLSNEDLAARFDALDQLDQYAKLLNDIVTSDITEKVTESANGLKTALDGLAERIDKLRDDSASASGNATDSESKPNTTRFKEKFGIVSEIASGVLSFIAKKKRDDALKRAIEKGDAPVNDLIEAIKSDLNTTYRVRRDNVDRQIIDVFQAYNIEITSKSPNQGRLDELEKAVLDNLEAEDAFINTNPKDALTKMQEAHTKLVRYARKEANEAEVLGAVQSYVAAATRLGAAVVKLKEKNTESIAKGDAE